MTSAPECTLRRGEFSLDDAGDEDEECPLDGTGLATGETRPSSGEGDRPLVPVLPFRPLPGAGGAAERLLGVLFWFVAKVGEGDLEALLETLLSGLRLKLRDLDRDLEFDLDLEVIETDLGDETVELLRGLRSLAGEVALTAAVADR